MSQPQPIHENGTASSLQQLIQDPQARRILDERAQQLLQQHSSAATDSGEDVLIFRLGESGYSIPAHTIREVQPLGAFAPLPFTPPFVVGLINVRGRLLTLIDLRPLLDVPAAPEQNGQFLIVLITHNIEVALLADSITAIIRTPNEQISSFSPLAGHVTWIKGIDSSLNLILDPAALMADPRLSVNTGIVL